MSRFDDWKTPLIKHGKLTQWNWMVQYPEGLEMGKYVDIGAFTYINAKFGVVLKDWVQIGSHCSVYSWSTIDNKKGKVILERNCRIGSHTVILPGVIIGENSIVGAHSLVIKNVPPNSVAYGVPAKVQRKLTSDELEKYVKETKI